MPPVDPRPTARRESFADASASIESAPARTDRDQLRPPSVVRNNAAAPALSSPATTIVGPAAITRRSREAPGGGAMATTDRPRSIECNTTGAGGETETASPTKMTSHGGRVARSWISIRSRAAPVCQFELAAGQSAEAAAGAVPVLVGAGKVP